MYAVLLIVHIVKGVVSHCGLIDVSLVKHDVEQLFLWILGMSILVKYVLTYFVCFLFVFLSYFDFFFFKKINSALQRLLQICEFSLWTSILFS